MSRITQHVKDHRTMYLIGAGCFAAGFVLRKPGRPIINNILDKDILREVVEETGKSAPTFINTVNNNNTVENNIGRVSKIVRDVATGEEWAKIRYLAEKLAEEHGISYDSARVMLGKHFRGDLDTVYDKVYEISGLRTNLA
jgi:hypothetical protein